MCLLLTHFLSLSEPVTSWQRWQLTGFYLFRHLQRKNKINNGIEEGKEDSDIDSQREGSWNTGQGDRLVWELSVWVTWDVKGESKQCDGQQLCVWGMAKRCPGASTWWGRFGVEEDQQKKGEKEQLYLSGALSIFATYLIVCLFVLLSTCGYRLTVSSPRSNMAWVLCRYPSCCCINCIMVST